MKKFINKEIAKMKIIKLILEIFIITMVTLCGFGGGFIIFGLPIIYLFQPTSIICKIMVIITIFIPMAIAWYIAPKINDKFL